MVYNDAVDDTRVRCFEMASFCHGTSLMTANGEQPVDWIRSGDRVMTKDHGFQKVLWVARTVIPANALKSTPHLQPIMIAANSVNAQTPAQDLHLSPDHRVLLKSQQIELHFGTDEVLAPIKAFADGDAIAQVLPQHDVSYYHILFQKHEIVLADGLWVESFFPGEMALASLSAKKQAQIHAALGAEIDTLQTARICLTPWEINLLVPSSTAKALPNLSVA